jgi:hypothetical protein
MGATTNAAFKQVSVYNGSTTVAGGPTIYEQGVQFLRFPSQTLGIAVGLSAPGNPLPSILTTRDLGMTWQARARSGAYYAPRWDQVEPGGRT